jgi:acyl carrier protein
MPSAGALELLRAVLEKEFAIPADAVRPAALLADDLDLDSLDRAHLAIALAERELGLDDEQIAAVETVGQLLALVEASAATASDAP